MNRVIRTEFSDKTVIAVAHQLRTVVELDVVVVMDNGRIVESGKPSDLLEENGSAFRRLWDAQA